jgi:hypothetical protein
MSQENKQQLNLTRGFYYMSKILGWFGASTLGILLPASVGLADQVVEPQLFNSETLVSSRILVAQSYSCPGCTTDRERFTYFEREGDQARAQADKYYYGRGVRRNYNRAYEYFHMAVNKYDLCLSVDIRDGASASSIRRVTAKRNNAAKMRETTQQLRASQKFKQLIEQASRSRTAWYQL